MKHLQYTKEDIGLICVHIPRRWEFWKQPAVHFTPADDDRFWCIPWDRKEQFIKVAEYGKDAMINFAETFGHRMTVKP